MSVSNKRYLKGNTYPTTVREKRLYRKFRQERRDTAELREAFERQQYREERKLLDYLRVKGELE